MRYLDLIKASRGRDKLPSLEKRRWRTEERSRADKGLCIKCGAHPAGANSFLCPACEAAISREDVLSEIASARKQVLSGG